MPIAIPILGILVVSLVVGSLLNFTFLFLAIPLILIFFGAIAGTEALNRQRRIWQMKRFRRSAKAHKVEFDDEDRKTIAVRRRGRRKAGQDRIIGLKLQGMGWAGVSKGMPGEPLARVLLDAVRHGGGELDLLPAVVADGG